MVHAIGPLLIGCIGVHEIEVPPAMRTFIDARTHEGVAIPLLCGALLVLASSNAGVLLVKFTFKLGPRIHARSMVRSGCCAGEQKCAGSVHRHILGGAVVIAIAWPLVSEASRARAFSDPHSYELEVAEGGGGGRWFTGTPADGYGCDVCHDAPGSVPIEVSGLPLDGGYSAAQSYEIGVRWPHDLEHLALVLEVVDDAGMRAGALALPRFDASLPEERCTEEGAEDTPASELIDSPGGRQFATVIDCGSRAVRMLWTAPATSTGRVWLSGGLVASDDDASVKNDVAVLIHRPVAPVGASLGVVPLTDSGCSIRRVTGRGDE